jgi:maltose alpha-D-glucosyltransferase/alpha-amylase
MLPKLSGAAASEARQVLDLKSEIGARFGALPNAAFPGLVRIRHHGDYHLGQLLFTGPDFMIIDFEGQPARPLAERRAKGLAMRDVAGMLRSFQYAAYTALFGQVSGVPQNAANAGEIESWAALWNAWIEAAYLQAYFDETRRVPYVPPDLPARRLLLDVFLLEKALYEVAYELDNRPTWVRIPLRGILGLLT